MRALSFRGFWEMVNVITFDKIINILTSLTLAVKIVQLITICLLPDKYG